jgi:hypothetical protein
VRGGAEVDVDVEPGPQPGGDLVRPAEDDQPTPVQHGHAVGEPPGLPEEVGAEHDRPALFGSQPGDEPDHLAGRRGIQARGRLVEEQDLGSVEQGPGQSDPLPLPGREPVDPAVREVRERELVDEVVDPGRRLRGRQPPDAGREDEVLAGGEPVVQPGVLGQHPRALTNAVALDRGVEAEHPGSSRVGGQDAVEQADRGRLARPIGPEQRQHLARPDLEAEVVDRAVGAEGLAQALGRDGGRTPRRPGRARRGRRQHRHGPPIGGGTNGLEEPPPGRLAG